MLNARLLLPRPVSTPTFLISFSFFSIPANSQLWPETGEDESVVSSAYSIIRGLRSRSRWNYLRSVHPAGFTPAQVAQIALRLRNNPRLALRFFLWSDHKALCRHDSLSYSAIIHILARSRLRSAAQDLIRAALRASEPAEVFKALARTYRTCDSAPFVFDLLIRACLQSEKVEPAIEIVRLLRSRGIWPALPTCNLLIRSVCKVRGSDAGLAIFGEIFTELETAKVSPNAQIFNTLLLSCYRKQFYDKMQEVCIKMGEIGVNLNIFSYCILMAAACDQRKMEEAMNLWGEMRRNRIEPDAMAYNTLIRGFCEDGNVERGEELLREMVMGGMEPTCVTYEYLIKGHCQVGVVEPALALFDDMRRRDFRPEASVVGDMIRELCSKRRVCDGLRVLRLAMVIECFFPDRKSYEHLIRGLCAEGRIEEAQKLQAEMAGKGFEPDFDLYSAFMEGYRKAGDSYNLKKLQAEMLQMGFLLPAELAHNSFS